MARGEYAFNRMVFSPIVRLLNRAAGNLTKEPGKGGGRRTKKSVIEAAIVAEGILPDLIQADFPNRDRSMHAGNGTEAVFVRLQEPLIETVTSISKGRKERNEAAMNAAQIAKQMVRRGVPDSLDSVFEEVLARHLYRNRLKFKLVVIPVQLTDANSQTVADEYDQLFVATGYHPKLKPLVDDVVSESEIEVLRRAGTSGRRQLMEWGAGDTSAGDLRRRSVSPEREADKVDGTSDRKDGDHPPAAEARPAK